MDYRDCDLSSFTTSSRSSSSSPSSGLSSYSTSVLTLGTNYNYNNNNNKQRSSTECKYKGVVPQPNGRWGAQLYNSNKRVWIGTYNCQHQAAHAYDMAVIRFRGVQAITNYPINHYGRPHLELDFLAGHTQARVIEMLRNHTYEEELARFMRARQARKQGPGLGGGEKELLFRKVMTPSDVGRLHRLVIPKHHAQSYLPSITQEGESKGREIMLSFEDVNKDRVWRFKYCYWKSSQNYVLTKGWGEFVKDKGLKPGDTVLFYCTTLADSQKRFSIDTSCKEGIIVKDDNRNDDVALSSTKVAIRLFGVDICSSLRPVTGFVSQGGGDVQSQGWLAP